MTIITITGKNGFAASQKLSELRDEFTAEHGDTGLLEMSAEEATFEQIVQAVSAQGLFSTGNLVVLRGLASNKYLQEQLTGKFEMIPEGSELIIYEPNFDRRSAVFKKLKTESVFHDFAELDERELAKWAVDAYKTMGGELGLGEANFMAQRVNLDQWALQNELEKLINLNQPITRKLIEEMVSESFNETVFNLLDQAFSKQSTKAIENYRKMRANRVEPHYILSMLVWQLHNLLVVAYAGNRSAEQIAGDHKLSPFVVKKSMGLLQRTSRRELKDVVNRAVTIDRDSKSLSGYDVDSAVDLLIAEIST